MSLAALLHLALHIVLPSLVAWIFFSGRRCRAWAIIIATTFVDLDHLLATPFYDPNRCSIGFHPLHTVQAIAAYALLLFVPRTRHRAWTAAAHAAGLLRLHRVRGFAGALSRLIVVG